MIRKGGGEIKIEKMRRLMSEGLVKIYYMESRDTNPVDL